MAQTVLLVVQETSERDILSKVLQEKLAYNTIDMASDSEAHNHLASEGCIKPDIILFDISKVDYPYEKITAFRVMHAHIPIVVLTKYGDYDSAMASINAGAQDFLTKPVAIERMNVTFRNLLIIRDLYAHNHSGNAMNYIENMMSLALFDDKGDIRSMQELELEAINRAIQRYDGRMTEVARKLGIGRSTLYRRLNGKRMPEEAA